jgi:rhamnose utilization protein RhaD (predicted bifunctional aldolase and dehydrogenase)
MTTPQPLIDMTLALGEPSRDYVIIGEGNTSTRVDTDTFYVKASGHQMASITADGFVGVKLAPILDLLDDPPATRSEMKAQMMDARIDPTGDRAPSIETSFHAMLLAETGIRFVGHTHPSPVNQLACSIHAETFATRRQFPDHAVVCGPEACFVPYADPGLPLAIIMRDRLREFTERRGYAPREMVLANHGLIALGETPEEVLNITAMSVKAAQIMLGSFSVGGPTFMDPDEADHIYNRPDEIYRRDLFK